MDPYKIRPAILVGGASRRMGQDKSLMMINGVPNSQRLYGLAGHVFGCEPVFCGQKKPDLSGLFLADADVARGPMDALVALGQRFPDQAVCLIACDLIRLSLGCLDWLKSQFLADQTTSVIPKNEAGYLEPTLAIYHPSAHKVIMKDAQAGQFSLQRLNLDAHNPLIPKAWAEDFKNANFPEDWPS